MNPVQSTVQHTLLDGKKTPDAIATLHATCNAGAQCAQVQASPIASAALGDLTSKTATADGSMVTKKKVDQDAKAAAKTLRKDVKAAKVALGVYETAVGGICGGDAAVINKAGLLDRPVAPAAPATIVEKVTKLTSTVGKVSKVAKLSWPAAPGAASYAVQVNFNPATPAGPWVSLGTCTRRTKQVTTPTAAAPFLAQIASVASDGTQGEWCEAFLGTSR